MDDVGGQQLPQEPTRPSTGPAPNPGAELAPKTKFRGVSKNLQVNAWSARICRHPMVHALGVSNSAEQAARRYDAASFILFEGSIGRMNFPLEFADLTMKQGRALAVRRLGEGCVTRLECAAAQASATSAQPEPPRQRSSLSPPATAQPTVQPTEAPALSPNGPDCPAPAAPIIAAAAVARTEPADRLEGTTPTPRVLRSRMAPQKRARISVAANPHERRRRPSNSSGSDGDGPDDEKDEDCVMIESTEKGSGNESDDWRPGRRAGEGRISDDDDGGSGEQEQGNDEGTRERRIKRRAGPTECRPVAVAAPQPRAQHQQPPGGESAEPADPQPGAPRQRERLGGGLPLTHFKFVYKHPDAGAGASTRKSWYGKIRGKAQEQLVTNRFVTAEEAARAVDRYIYKVKGRAACNFPVTPEMVAELDGLTVKDLQEQFRHQRTYGLKRSATQYRNVTCAGTKWIASLKKWGETVVVMTRADTSEEAARAADAAAYLLRGSHKDLNFPERYANLTKEQGRALALRDIGEEKVQHLDRMKEVQRSLSNVEGRWAVTWPRKRWRHSLGSEELLESEQNTFAELQYSDEQTEEPDLEVQVDLAAEDEGSEQQQNHERPGGGQQQQQQVPGQPPLQDGPGVAAEQRLTEHFASQVQTSINHDMVSDAWMEVWQLVFADQAAGGNTFALPRAPSSSSSSSVLAPGSTPHLLVRQATEGVGGPLGCAQRRELADAWAVCAWQAALAQAELDARHLDPQLRADSLHRLTYLVAYGKLWLQQAGKLCSQLPDQTRQVLQSASGDLERATRKQLDAVYAAS